MSQDQSAILLLEYIRRGIKNYLGFYKELYNPTLPFKADNLKVNYRLIKTGSSPGSVKPAGSEKKIKEKMDISDIISLKELKNIVTDCRNCELHKGRNKTVFGKGAEDAKLVIIGEAPGAEEDKTGEPFVGRAGKLLTKMLEAIDLKRDDVFICNVLKCRPPGNRDPLPAEITKCSNYLDKQLDIIQPKYILALGRIAAQRLLNEKKTMKEFRNSEHEYKGIPVLVTYHPSALLRNSKWKYPAWDDLKKLKRYLDLA